MTTPTILDWAIFYGCWMSAVFGAIYLWWECHGRYERSAKRFVSVMNEKHSPFNDHVYDNIITLRKKSYTKVFVQYTVISSAVESEGIIYVNGNGWSTDLHELLKGE